MRFALVGGVLMVMCAAAAHGDELPEEITVATWNLEWFFDAYLGDNSAKIAKEQSAPSREEWDWKRQVTARAIAELKPTILAVQEVESARVLYYLTRELREAHDLEYRVAFIEGSDLGTEQDVALLYQHGLVEYSRREQTQEMFASKDFYHLNKHIIGRFEWGSGRARETLTILNLHLRAMPENEAIRVRQARLARDYVLNELERGANVIVLGDLNSNETFAAASDNGELAVLRGLHGPPELQLFDAHEKLPEGGRSTHLAGGEFDRILLSPSLLADAAERRDLVFDSVQLRKDICVRGAQPDADHWNVYYDIPRDERDVSDHYPLVVRLLVK